MERLPGFRDFYPEPLPGPDEWSASVRQHLFNRWRAAAQRYGFREYDGAPLEPLELYTLKSGQEIVGQLYNFVDKGGRDVALRPEMTPTLARLIGAHERNYKKPIKWFAIPQLFRYERQQKGRLREHFQFNADIVGEAAPAADAELIALLIDSLRDLGLGEGDFVIRLSSRSAWQEFFGRRSGDLARVYDFFQAIDKLEREDPAGIAARLKPLGFSLEEVTAFIQAATPTGELNAILESLEARNLSRFVKIDYRVVRGLAYYTGPVFEVFDARGEFRAIAGGGRYDNLIKLITGGRVDLPALGFGMGDVVLTELLKQRGLLPASSAAPIHVVVLIEDEAARPESLRAVQRLREAGYAVEYSLTPSKPDKQFKRALELNAAFTVRLEPAAAGGGEWIARLKRLRDRRECAVPADALLGALTEWRGS